MTTEKLSWPMREALRAIRAEEDKHAHKDWVRPVPSIHTNTLEALERRGLVVLRYDTRVWRFECSLTVAGREAAG